MPLFDREGSKIWLRIPDLSGEIFMDLINERQLKKDISDQLKAADTILFFLNPDTITEDRRIPLGEKSAMEIVEKDYEKAVIESAKRQSEEISSEQKRQVTQADLVELLQCTLYLTKKRIKIKFIISAWDSVEKRLASEELTPEKCMEKMLPLVFQFLRSNPDRIDGEIWGVSAQGFDFTDPEELEQWKMYEIGERARAITPTGDETHDLTRLLILN